MWQGESGGTRLDWMLRDSIVYPEILISKYYIKV